MVVYFIMRVERCMMEIRTVHKKIKPTAYLLKSILFIYMF